MFLGFSFFFLFTDRPTHFHEREGDGKQNNLWGWSLKTEEDSLNFTNVTKLVFDKNLHQNPQPLCFVPSIFAPDRKFRRKEQTGDSLKAQN